MVNNLMIYWITCVECGLSFLNPFPQPVLITLTCTKAQSMIYGKYSGLSWRCQGCIAFQLIKCFICYNKMTMPELIVCFYFAFFHWLFFGMRIFIRRPGTALRGKSVNKIHQIKAYISFFYNLLCNIGLVFFRFKECEPGYVCSCGRMQIGSNP